MQTFVNLDDMLGEIRSAHQSTRQQNLSRLELGPNSAEMKKAAEAALKNNVLSYCLSSFSNESSYMLRITPVVISSMS